MLVTCPVVADELAGVLNKPAPTPTPRVTRASTATVQRFDEGCLAALVRRPRIPGAAGGGSGSWVWLLLTVELVVAGRDAGRSARELREEEQETAGRSCAVGDVGAVVMERDCAEGGVCESDLLEFCRENLSGWQVPKRIFFVDEIPVNERGKVSRRELAQRFRE